MAIMMAMASMALMLALRMAMAVLLVNTPVIVAAYEGMFLEAASNAPALVDL